MTNDPWQMNNNKVRSPDNELPLVIFHWSLVIFFLCALSGREKKCIAGFQPAKVVLTQKELSRLRCRRDAGATIFSHDQRLRGEILWLRLLGWRSVAPCSPRSEDFATLPGLAHLYNRPYMEAHEIGRLVRAAREGDRAAFQAIYEHFVKRIYNFLFRMVGSADEAEDLTQQTFLQALRQLGRLRDAGQIESWIYRIARNEAYQKFRRKDADSWDDRDNERQMRKLREVRIHAQPDHNLMNAELGQVIQRVLDSLPAKLREVFVLAVIQGMSYQETATLVGRSLLSVKTDIYRARLLVKEELGKYTGARPGSAFKGKMG